MLEDSRTVSPSLDEILPGAPYDTFSLRQPTPDTTMVIQRMIGLIRKGNILYPVSHLGAIIQLGPCA